MHSSCVLYTAYLMLGRDLKHLNVQEKFLEARTRFHAVKALLTLK